MRLSPSGDFANAARDCAHIVAKPLASAMGAEVLADLRDLSNAAFAEVQDALWRHKMIFVRAQNLSHAEHESFARRWGKFATDAYTQGVPGHRNVQPVIKESRRQ